MKKNVCPINFVTYTQKDVSDVKIQKDVSNNSDIFQKLLTQSQFNKIIEEIKNKPYFKTAETDSINLYNLSIIAKTAIDKAYVLEKKLKDEFSKASMATFTKTESDFIAYNVSFENAELAKTEATLALAKLNDLEKETLFAEASISASINNVSAIADYNVAKSAYDLAKKEATLAVAKSDSLEIETAKALEKISENTCINCKSEFDTYDVILVDYTLAKEEANIAYANNMIAAKKAKLSLQILDLKIKPFLKTEDNIDTSYGFDTFTNLFLLVINQTNIKQ